MSAPPSDATWEATEHTLAKIAILRAYLQAWFAILGRTAATDMLYIDGFAGPGIYQDGQEGSPIIAVKAACEARAKAGEKWKAKIIRMIFVELDKKRFGSLQSQLKKFETLPGLEIQLINNEFALAFSAIKGEHKDAFISSMPFFAFLDPFGVKGVPFQTVRDMLASQRSEVFLLLDADGMERIRKAGVAAGHQQVLDTAFGSAVWSEISFSGDAKSNARKLLAAYRQQLRQAAGVKFTFPFEMRRNNGVASYHLLFATNHIRGLEKMKEAMRKVDKNFVFTDGKSGQNFMFAPDEPAVLARDAEDYFNAQCFGRERSYDDLKAWILQDTPYTRAERILDAIKGRKGIASATIGGKVAEVGNRPIKWEQAQKIKFRDHLQPPEKRLFD